jgi:hypothetical protein
MGRLFFVIVLLFGLLTVYNLSAKKKSGKSGSTKYKYKKQTEVEFDEVELDGAFQKPEGYYSLKAKKTKFDDMIEPKVDFLDELKNSVYSIDEE